MARVRLCRKGLQGAGVWANRSPLGHWEMVSKRGHQTMGRKPRTLGVGELGWATRKTDTEATMDVRRLLGVGVIIIAGCMERRVYNK